MDISCHGFWIFCSLSSSNFKGGPLKATKMLKGDTTLKPQVASAISSRPRLPCDTGTILGCWGVLRCRKCRKKKQNWMIWSNYSELSILTRLPRGFILVGGWCGWFQPKKKYVSLEISIPYMASKTFETTKQNRNHSKFQMLGELSWNINRAGTSCSNVEG